MRRLILVDSTRSGKRIPDALSKTVPIWCAVINRAMLLLHPHLRENDTKRSWDTALYTPPATVSKLEHHEIEKRLDGWAAALAVSSLICTTALSFKPYSGVVLRLTSTHSASSSSLDHTSNDHVPKATWCYKVRRWKQQRVLAHHLCFCLETD